MQDNITLIIILATFHSCQMAILSSMTLRFTSLDGHLTFLWPFFVIELSLTLHLARERTEQVDLINLINLHVSRVSRARNRFHAFASHVSHWLPSATILLRTPPPLSLSLSRFLLVAEKKGEREKVSFFRLPNDPSFWSAPTVIRVRHSRRLAFVPLSWYRPDTGDLDSLAEEIYPTFDSRSFVRSFVRSLGRSLARSSIHLNVCAFFLSFVDSPRQNHPRRRIDRGSPIITHVRTPQRSPRDVDVGGSTKATTMREQFALDRKYWIGRSLSYFGAVGDGRNLVLNHARLIARAFFLSFSLFACDDARDSARRVPPPFIFPFVPRHQNVWRIIPCRDLAVNGIIR